MVRYCLTIILAGTLAMGWLSCLTHDPRDFPGTQIFPAGGVVHNYAGSVGALISHGLFVWLGSGAYMGLLFGSVAVVLILMGATLRDPLFRVIGVVLLMASTSTAVWLISPYTPGDDLFGNGGVLGAACGIFILQHFGQFSWLMVLITALVGLVLAADSVVMQVPRVGKRLWGQREQLTRMASALRTAAAGAASARHEVGPGTVTTSPRVASAGRSAASGPASVRMRATPARPAKEMAAPAKKPSLGERFKSLLTLGKKLGQALSTLKPGLDASASKSPAEKAGPVPAKTIEPAAQAAMEPPAAPRAKAPAPLTPLAPRVAAPKPAPRPVARPASKPAAPLKPGEYEFPSEDLLTDAEGGYIASQEAHIELKRSVLQQTLDDFNVEAQVVGYMTGPVITMFELSLAPGVKVSQIANLANDIARALAAPGVRIVSPIPGKDTIGIEVPNAQKETVRLKDLMQMSPEKSAQYRLPVYLGKDAGGDPIVADLASMPHMLIAGTTGSGKSVCINTIIMSLLMTRTPQEVRLILVDPKMVEMAAFECVQHLLCPIVNDMRKAESILEWAATKMDERYEVLKDAGVKNIAGYNKLTAQELYERFGAETDEEKAQIELRIPYFVIIIDELADLIMTSSKEVENYIIRIAQKARAVGIHLILATQRPSVNVVTGLIKSNMPCRISFRVASRQESRIVLDQNGAEVLLGQGDMLFLLPGTSTLARAQGTYVDDGEIRGVVNHLRKLGEQVFNQELVSIKPAGMDGEDGMDSGERDDLFDKAVEIILQSQRGSVSLLQRRLGVGYSRASRIVDQMAEAGILGDYKGSQARECMMTLEDWRIMKTGIDADQSGDSSIDGEPTSS